MESEFFSANLLEQYLGKPSSGFTSDDIISYVLGTGVRMVNFRYVAEDGKLKVLNFRLNSKEHLKSILTSGERVDGSSLFSFIRADSSDLYIVPRFKTAFRNPFSEIPAVDILCSFYNSEGKPLENAPEYILKKANDIFMTSTGYVFKAMGELEYYVQGTKEELYPGEDQRGYHSSAPFCNFEFLRLEAMELISQSGGKIKYGHSEVGNFSTDAESFEQHEIEFLPVDPEDAVDQLVVAKWILRSLGDKYNVNLSFAPKITTGKAGSGMHVHMMLEKDGKSQMVEKGILSPVARRMIAGLMDLAPALTAFGNTIPTSYLRLVPHQEAPTSICWGERNRSVLVRVPLGWSQADGMVYDSNPMEKRSQEEKPVKQTIEIRSPDGSADLYHLFAGLIVAAKYGLEMDNALEKAERLYVAASLESKENGNKSFELLPDSCVESAIQLENRRYVFEKDGIFPAGTIDNFIRKLKDYNDKGLSERLEGKTEDIRRLVYKYLHHM